MKLRIGAALATLGLTALLAASVIVAQVRVRIVRQDNTAEEKECGGETEKPEVEGIEPTPEEFEQIAALIRQLGAPTLAQRDRAMSELAAFEKRALGQVREARNHDDDEIANRCTILEEVIESGQGELFLAARRLNLSIGELQEYIGNDDVTPLLNILRSRAQPGMVPLWSMILARLSGRSQLYPAAVVCREVEGSKGYGQAVSRACRADEVEQSAPNLRRLLVLLPPGDPRDTVEALTQLRFTENGSLEDSLSAAGDFRGVYAAEATLGAIQGRPDPQDEDPENAPEVRTAMALALTGNCTGEDLARAELPSLSDMSPLLLSQWLGLARRSGLKQVIASAFAELREDGADARRISIAAGAWADVTPVPEVIEAFGELPSEARLSALDSLWRNPRNPKVLHPWLMRLLEGEHPGLRLEAAHHLGQYRSPGSVGALVKCVREDAAAAPAALKSLKPMADLLTESQREALAALLPDAGLNTRIRLVEVLMAAGHKGALEALTEQWKVTLPRNELVPALKVLAMDPSTPAGSYAKAVTVLALNDDEPLDRFLLLNADNSDLEMLRVLLARDAESGFALLASIAGDVDAAARIKAMTALALAGRDEELIDDWLKRLAGEIKDPHQSRIGMPVAMSMTAPAEEFLRDAMQRGNRSSNLQWVVLSVLAGRTQEVTREELADVLFDTPDNSTRWARNWRVVSVALNARAAQNVAAALVYDNGSSLFSDPSISLLLRSRGVDFLEVLYGRSDNPEPRTPSEILLTALMGEPVQAARILDKVTAAEDGSNYAELEVANAWLRRDGEGRRIARAVSSKPTNTFGALWRMERAGKGDVQSLRGLFDAFGPDAARFTPGVAAAVELRDSRWSSPEMVIEGVAAAGVKAESAPPVLEGGQLAPLFAEAPPGEWRDWWSSRRALVQFDEASGRYNFVELP